MVDVHQYAHLALLVALERQEPLFREPVLQVNERVDGHEPVVGIDNERRVVVEPLEQPSEEVVDDLVDAQNCVFVLVRSRVARMRLVPELPVDVFRAVRVLEHEEEEVPRLLLHQVERLGGVDLRRFDQAFEVSVEVALQVLPAAVDAVARYLLSQLGGELGRIRVRVDSLGSQDASNDKAVDGLGRIACGEVNDAGLAAIVVQDVPELVALDVGCVDDCAAIAIARNADKVVNVVFAGVLAGHRRDERGRRQRRDRRRERSDGALSDQTREVGQVPLVDPRTDDAETASVDAYGDDPAFWAFGHKLQKLAHSDGARLHRTTYRTARFRCRHQSDSEQGGGVR